MSFITSKSVLFLFCFVLFVFSFSPHDFSTCNCKEVLAIGTSLHVLNSLNFQRREISRKKLLACEQKEKSLVGFVALDLLVPLLYRTCVTR